MSQPSPSGGTSDPVGQAKPLAWSAFWPRCPAAARFCFVLRREHLLTGAREGSRCSEPRAEAGDLNLGLAVCPSSPVWASGRPSVRGAVRREVWDCCSAGVLLCHSVLVVQGQVSYRGTGPAAMPHYLGILCAAEVGLQAHQAEGTEF